MNRKRIKYYKEKWAIKEPRKRAHYGFYIPGFNENVNGKFIRDDFDEKN